MAGLTSEKGGTFRLSCWTADSSFLARPCGPVQQSSDRRRPALSSPVPEDAGASFRACSSCAPPPSPGPANPSPPDRPGRLRSRRAATVRVGNRQPNGLTAPGAHSAPDLHPGKHAISGTTPGFNRPLSRKTPQIRDEPPPQTTLHPGKHAISGTTPGFN